MRNSAVAILLFGALSAELALPSLRTTRADDAKPATKGATESSAEQVAAASSADKKDPWKPEDVIYAESANPQTRISPDAKWLVWVKSSGDKEKDARVIEPQRK